MTLASVQFVIFLAVVYLLWRFVAPGALARKVLLLAASYAFYATWDLRFLVVLLALTLLQWLVGGRIQSAEVEWRRKGWLAVSLFVALGNLAYFKYANFFLGELSSLMVELGLGELGVLGRTFVPIGISFYTFQSLTYTIDIYRRDERATASLLDFALFVGFFGHVTAGPISRSRLLMPQIECVPERVPSLDAQAVFLIARGFVKKVAFADVLAAEFVSPAFTEPNSWSGAFLVTAVVAYSLQIYMDVSGYTDLARGVGRCFGFDLAVNFDRPYLSRTVSNYWQRWHMSMSGFFRDYLYFGLGGSRRGNVYLNLMVTFIAIGIWHGAGWNFVAYGALHGGMVCFERWRRARSGTVNVAEATGGLAVAVGVMTTFGFVAASRILFVESDLAGAVEFVRAIFLSDGNVGAASWRGYLTLGIAIGLHFLPRQVEQEAANWFFSRAPYLQALGLIVLTMALVVLAIEQRPFVYFRF